MERIRQALEAETEAAGDAGAMSYLLMQRVAWGALRWMGFVPEGVAQR